MKRLGHLYEKLIDVDYIEDSIYKAFRKKKKTRSIRRILANPRKHAERISSMIQNGELPFVKERNIMMIQDGKMQKWRSITKASNYEHVVHHAIIGLLESRMIGSFYQYSVASIPNRGDLFGKKHMDRWIRSYKGRKLYALKFDIHKFFDSIDRNILLSKLCRIIKDRQFIEVLTKIIFFDKSVTDHGVPIGYYTSQWFANFYLTSFDNHTKQSLGVSHYMRYMDDCVVLLQNKRKLRNLFALMRAYLSEHLALSVKSNWQIFMMAYKPTRLMLEDGWHRDRRYGRPIDFMGYKFYPWKTTIRKSTLKSCARAVRRFLSKTNVKNARSLQSFVGRLRHANTHKYLCGHVYKYIDFKVVSKIISKSDKERMYGILQI